MVLITTMQMNYAVAIFGIIMIFALVYWQIGGKKFYTGPIQETVHGIEPMNETTADHHTNKAAAEN
jgi:hypothetical protein